jgi:mannose-6-phosphate isomerase-like protein (cupin superfamily)
MVDAQVSKTCEVTTSCGFDSHPGHNMKNLSKLANGKYFSGSFKEFSTTKGWFLGSFFPTNSPLKTDKLEIMYKEHRLGDEVPKHFHKKKVEVLIVLEGSAQYTINNSEVIIKSGDFLFIDVYNFISGKFLSDSKIFAIHSPSLPEDKYV